MRTATLDLTSARAAGVQTVLTRSGCADAWPTRYAADLTPLGERSYDSDGATITLSLWQLTP